MKKTKRKLKRIKLNVDIVNAMGKGHREQYLEQNPHGYKSVRKVHKNKKKYTRKGKYKNF